MRTLPILLGVVLGLAEPATAARPARGVAQTPAVPAGPTQDAEARAREMARRAADRIRALRRESDALAAQERELLAELRRIEAERAAKATELARIGADLTATADAIRRTEAEAARLEEVVARQTPKVQARLVELYKLGQAGYWRVLLDVDDVRTLGRAYRHVSALARLDQEQIRQHKKTLAELAETRTVLAGRQTDMRALQARELAARTALDRAASARQARIADIDERRDLAAVLTGELQVAQRRLQAAVGELARGGTADVSLPLRPFRGDLDWPLEGRVVSEFGRQVSSRFGTDVQRNGVEIAAGEGTAVRAVHGGSVAFADAFSGYGYLVILDHGDDAYSLYGYLGALSVRKGDRVERQTIMGAVGPPPAGAVPRLYFEIRVDGRPVDPVEWLKTR